MFSSHFSNLNPLLFFWKGNSYSLLFHSFADETALILLRHGESMWNEKNLFTGCVDVPLTQNGANEAIEAGKRICSIPVDMIYTSVLIRAQMTAMLAMAQHRSKKVSLSSYLHQFCHYSNYF